MSTGRSVKTDAIRAALKSGKPLTLPVLVERVERRLKQIVSKQRLYGLLAVMKNAREIDTAGRGDARTYWLKRP